MVVNFKVIDPHGKGLFFKVYRFAGSFCSSPYAQTQCQQKVLLPFERNVFFSCVHIFFNRPPRLVGAGYGIFDD